MFKFGKDKYVFILIWMLLSPSLLLTIDVEASGNLQTSITSTNGYFVSDNQINTSSSTNITFTVEATSGSFTNGEYSYIGVINGNGSYTNNTVLQLQSNLSGSITLIYRALGYPSDELNNTVVINFDLSPPLITINTVSNSLITSQGNSSSSPVNITLSPSGISMISCEDDLNLVSSINVHFANQSTLVSTNSSNSLTLNASILPPNLTHHLYATCSDNVGNTFTRELYVTIDGLQPVFQVSTSHPVYPGTCVPPNWYLSTLSSDQTLPITEYYSIDNNLSWNLLSTPFQPNLNFTGNLALYAEDAVSNKNFSSIDIFAFDQYPPSINISSYMEEITVYFSDDCGIISNGLYRHEYRNGTVTPWTSVANNSVISFASSNQSNQYRINLKISDSSNRVTTTNSNWSFVRTIVNFDTTQGMINIGSYIGEDVRFTATPPTGGSFTSTFRHSNGSTSGGHTSQQTSAQTWGFSGMESGIVWLNITTTDAYGRTAIDVYSYTVDATVTSSPLLTSSGTNIVLNSSQYYGPNGRIGLSNIVDSGGIGPDYVECFWNSAASSITYSATSILTPPGTNGQTTAFTLKCRIVDLIGNSGPFTNMAGYVDLDGPTTLFTPLAGTTISENTTIGITVTDTILNGTSIATLQWTNATDSWNSTVSFNGSWFSTMSALNANLEDGTVTISVLAKDWLGNSQTVTLNSWTLNTTMTRTIVNFDTTQGMINIGSYIGEDVRFTATPPTGGSFTSSFQH